VRAQVSRSKVACPEPGCSMLFSRSYSAYCNCVRFRGKHLDGSITTPDEVAKMTERVKSSDRRRQEAKANVLTCSEVGPPVKSGPHIDSNAVGLNTEWDWT